jgi:hypothetical protein
LPDRSSLRFDEVSEGVGSARLAHTVFALEFAE